MGITRFYFTTKKRIDINRKRLILGRFSYVTVVLQYFYGLGQNKNNNI